MDIGCCIRRGRRGDTLYLELDEYRYEFADSIIGWCNSKRGDNLGGPKVFRQYIENLQTISSLRKLFREPITQSIEG